MDLYENAPCGYLSTLPDGTIAKVNQTFLSWTGFARGDLVGRRRFVDLLTAGGRIYHETHYAPLLRMQGAVREIAVEVVCADGRRLPVLVNSTLKTDAAGNPLLVRTTVFDATDRKEYERELMRAREKAERSESRLRALQTVTAELAAVLTVEQVAGAVVRSGRDAFGADAVVVWTIGGAADATGAGSAAAGAEALVPVAALGAGPVEPLRLDGPYASAVAGCELVVLGAGEGARAGTGAFPLLATGLGEAPARTVVLVPMVTENVVRGVLGLGFRDEPPLGADERELLRTLGRQAGVATERARLQEEAARQGRRSAFLLEASTVLAAASGMAETVERLARVAVPVLGDLCVIDVVDENGRLVRMAARHADPARQPLVDELRRYAPENGTAHPVVRALAERRSLVVSEMGEEFLRRATRSPRHYELVRALELTSLLTVPLVAGDRVLGNVTIVSAGSGRRFGTADLALVEELAAQVSLVVDKAQRYEREHRTSHALQASLLPSDLPEIPGLAIAVRYLPGTRDVEVGGDFYDVLTMRSGEVAVAVGDVVGHDITAAATMGQLRSACRALLGEVDGPAALVRRLQENWPLLGLDRLATAVYAALDPGTGALRVASAGHLAPLVLDADGCWPAPVEPSTPLGAPVVDVVEWHWTMPRHATLLLFTDGLVEDRHRDIDEGTERLAAAALAAGTTDPQRLCDHILAELAEGQRSDDVALLAITRT